MLAEEFAKSHGKKVGEVMTDGEIEQGLLFVVLLFVHSSDLDDLAHDFRLEAAAFGFGMRALLSGPFNTTSDDNGFGISQQRSKPQSALCPAVLDRHISSFNITG